MLKQVTLARDPFDPSSWTRHDVEDLKQFLMEEFDVWPASAAIYHGQPSVATDVTPPGTRLPNGEPTPEHLRAEERLRKLPGPFHVMVYPASNPLLEIGAIVATAGFAAPFVAAYELSRLLAPTPPTQHQYPGSPANSLGERSNQARIGGRIGDVYGQLRSVFDLIAVPYRVYEGGTAVEYSSMCIGRGEYDIQDVKDGTDRLNAALVSKSSSAAVQFYGPYKSPLNSNPDLSLPAGTAKFQEKSAAGTMVDVVPLAAKRSNSVNGQRLIRPDMLLRTNEWGDDQAGDLWAIPADSFGLYAFKLDDSSSRDLTQYFTDGQRVTVGDAIFGGTYTVDHVTPTRLYLVNAASVSGGWTGQTLPYRLPQSSTVLGVDNNWVGPFFLEMAEATQAFLNFVAPYGLYVIDQDLTDNDGNHPQLALPVTLQVMVVPTDEDGNDTAGPIYSTVTLMGSASERNSVGRTLKVPIGGYCRISVRNTQPRVGWNGSTNRLDDGAAWDDSRFLVYQDEIQWVDAYAVAPVVLPAWQYGNVTTCLCRTFATKDAAAVKERKLNALVTRKIPHRTSGTTFVAPSAPYDTCRRVDDIIVAIATDAYIGRRGSSDPVLKDVEGKPLWVPDYTQLDLDQIYATVAEVQAYFPAGEACVRFAYTYDQDNISFEETIGQVAAAAFCIAYRVGSKIRLNMERDKEPVLLFNHRNKVPSSETRTVRCGNLDNFDGVEYSYVSPLDDSTLIYYIPDDMSARNPKKIESVGIRSRQQAYYQAWRAWNKIRYQNTSVEFTACEEANLLVQLDKILVADNTRADTQDGDVIDQNGTELTLSRPVSL